MMFCRPPPPAPTGRSLLFIFLLLIVAKDIRAELKEDKACLPSIRTLKASADPTIAKHASIALEAVLWDP